MLDAELRRKVDQLWGKFWAGGLSNPLTAIDQLNYLMFLKRLEDSDDLQAQRAAAADKEHDSLFDGPQDRRRWSVWRNFGGEQMFQHVRDEIFPWMKGEVVALDNEAFRAFMKDAAFLIPKPSLLVEAVNVIQDLQIRDRNVDTQGDIYEYMLGKLSVAGQIGQFRTPRHIIRTMVSLLDPQVGETIADPACGTAGFLIAAYQHILLQNTSAELLEFDEDGAPKRLYGDRLSKEQWTWLNNGGLVGSDFDLTMVRIAAMNMVLHGLSNPRVRHADALVEGFSHSPFADVILANPPFSGSVEKSDISDEFSIVTQKTELLFVDLMVDLLKPGGRAAIIVPDGVLFGTSRPHKALKRKLLTDNTLQAVVSLPANAFKPYTGTSTSILILQRGGESESVWMFTVSADGYTLDDRREPIPENDLPKLLEAWPERRSTPRSTSVSADLIRSNGWDLSADMYMPLNIKRESRAKSRDLIKEVGSDLKDISGRFDQLLEKWS